MNGMKYNFGGLERKGKETTVWLQGELSSLRTGRATPALLDPITVDSYGSRLPLKHVAAISVEDARTLRIAPWDESVLKSIESAIAASSLGVQPIVDKNTVRITLPELTEERRKLLSRLVSEKLEEAKVAIRKERDEVWKDIQERERAGEMPEDDKFRFKEEMEKAVLAITTELETAAEKKRAELVS